MQEECLRYTQLIQDYKGFDIIFLGIGSDGHISFNMPNAAFSRYTHLEELSEETRKANAHFFDDNRNEVPSQAITIAMQTIMDTSKIVLLALGVNKAKIIKRLKEETLFNPLNPASILHLHKDVTIVLDESAASML